MKIKIRKAKISDIPMLVEKVYDFYSILKDKGAKDINQDDQVLRGGITIEIGNGFSNPNWLCVVAVKDDRLLAFMIGILEFCSPTAEDMSCVRIHANYLDVDSLVGGKVLLGLWGLMEDWARERGVGYFYANIHPGNQPSIRTAKKIGFKHHYTQFYRPLELEKTEE
jgi:hypothetical protein